MKITFLPVRSDDRLHLASFGDVLAINGQDIDFSVIPEGASLPEGAVDCPWICGPIERTDGVLSLTLLLPHGAVAPKETLFPLPLIVDRDGDIAFPAYEVSE
jgi:hypothetical protein